MDDKARGKGEEKGEGRRKGEAEWNRVGYGGRKVIQIVFGVWV